jgi:hypothetical protein
MMVFINKNLAISRWCAKLLEQLLPGLSKYTTRIQSSPIRYPWICSASNNTRYRPLKIVHECRNLILFDYTTREARASWFDGKCLFRILNVRLLDATDPCCQLKMSVHQYLNPLAASSLISLLSSNNFNSSKIILGLLV